MPDPAVALIIGGSGGIGSAVARRFLKAGARVYATYHRHPESAEALRQSDARCGIVRCDIRNEPEVREAVDTIVQTEGRIDVLINCSSPRLKLKLFDALSREDIEDDIQTILMGGIHVLKHTLPVMKKRKSGVVVTLLSAVVSRIPPSRMSSYVSAKFGVMGLIQSLTAELASSNIRFVLLSPSYVETPLLQSFPSKLLEIERAKRPRQQFLQPEDIAQATYDIVRNESKYPSGSHLQLDSREEIEG